MKKEYKDLWVKALRSGKYRQGMTCLNDGKKFCCLGVLCDILKDELELKWEWDRSPLMGCIDGETSILPHSVKNLVGLKSRNPLIEQYSRSLAELNDNWMSFPEIADVIEEEL